MCLALKFHLAQRVSLEKQEARNLIVWVFWALKMFVPPLPILYYLSVLGCRASVSLRGFLV